MADYRGIDIKEFAEDGLQEIAGLISRREYNRGIIKSRQLADRIIRTYAAERDIEYSTFADTIEKLYGDKIINMASRDAFHTIRIYGNKAVHEEDNSPDDAESTYYLLKREVQTFLSRKDVSVDRTPVRVQRDGYRTPARSSEEERYSAGYKSERPSGRRSSMGDYGDEETRRPRRDDRGSRDLGRSGGRPGRPERAGASDRRSGDGYDEEGGRRNISVYDIFRIIIPIVAVILIVIIIRSLIPSAPQVVETSPVETSTEAPVETEPETTVPETEPETEPPVVEYQIKGDAVNVRYADNQNRIYDQLDNGTVIGPVTPIEGSDFVQFTLDGVSVVVRNDLIEPVETSAETEAQAE